MRGFKFDPTETRLAFAEKRITDKRSFIGRAPDGSLHELLAGKDKSNRWEEIRVRAANLCQGCDTPHYVGVFGEWDHIQGGTSGRCDCLHNARFVCIAFHRKRHVHLKGGSQ